MIDLNLATYMEDELRRTPTKVHRYMYSRILWNDRMIGIVGPRGVGKLTMVKQYDIRLQQTMNLTMEVDIPNMPG